MINKFQQGGKQQDAVMQFVQGIAQVLQTDPNKVIQIAQQNPKALEQAVKVFQQTQDINQAAQAFTQSIQKAKQGAKLNYLKSLKHQCADDEELYYYKKGGSVDCGCKKKEDGGEVVKAGLGCSAVDKFKATRKADSGMRMMQLAEANKRRKQQAEANKKEKRNTWKENTKYYADKNATYKEPTEQDNAVRDRKENPENIVKKKSCGGAVKAFKEKCGAKMKKHQQGGSLNGIFFKK